MDQPNVSAGRGRGRGRGRGYALKLAIEEARRMKSEANTEKVSNFQEGDKLTVSDEDIKEWLKQVLSTSKGGIWTKHLQKRFSETFPVNTPDDLIRKIQSWPETFQIERITGGEIVRLSDEFLAAQRGNAEESVPNVAPVPDKFIQDWLKKELSKRQSGIPMADIPSLFKENFRVCAPEDLIAKLGSWPNVVQIQSVQGGDIVTLTPRPSPSRDQTMTSEANTEKVSNFQEGDKLTVSDEDIKEWLKQVLSTSKGAIWMKNLQKSFSETFPVNTPDDLIRKIQSWPETFQIESITGGEIVRLSEKCLAAQRGNEESVPNVAPVPDKFIQIWLKKELSKRQSGIPMADIPSLFKENFRVCAPEDLIAKLGSWPNVVQIQSVQGGDIVTLTPRPSPSRDQTKQQDENIHATKQRISTVCIPKESTLWDVHVLWSASPTLFCCIPSNLRWKLYSMMQKLNACLTAETNSIPQAALVQGDVYAGKHEDTWYRVIVKGFSEDNMVVTCLADYCFDVKLSTEKLQELPNRFLSLPFGSFKARLQGVDPVDGSSQWSEKAKEDFANITTGRDFVCLICDRPDDNEVVSVSLVDTSSEEDVVVDEIMEELDLVVRSPSQQHASF